MHWRALKIGFRNKLKSFPPRKTLHSERYERGVCMKRLQRKRWIKGTNCFPTAHDLPVSTRTVERTLRSNFKQEECEVATIKAVTSAVFAAARYKFVLNARTDSIKWISHITQVLSTRCTIVSRTCRLILGIGQIGLVSKIKQIPSVTGLPDRNRMFCLIRTLDLSWTFEHFKGSFPQRDSKSNLKRF